MLSQRAHAGAALGRRSVARLRGASAMEALAISYKRCVTEKFCAGLPKTIQFFWPGLNVAAQGISFGRYVQ